MYDYQRNELNWNACVRVQPDLMYGNMGLCNTMHLETVSDESSYKYVCADV